MLTIHPYVNFPGNTEEAFRFYQSVFGGEFKALIRFKDTPEAERMPEEARGKIMHISLPIGDSMLLMGTDALESMGHKLTMGNNFFLTITPTSHQEADEVYAKLSAGGKASLPMHESSWNSYFGMFTDKFGLQWMIDLDLSQQ
ncbi:MAG: VOC family protein [Rufibacter sp.]